MLCELACQLIQVLLFYYFTILTDINIISYYSENDSHGFCKSEELDFSVKHDKASITGKHISRKHLARYYPI